MSKNVLITGGSGGIGSATARLFASMGYNVGITYNSDKDGAERLCGEYSNIKAFKCDVSDRGGVETLFEEYHKSMGLVDILVNNAGMARQRLFLDITMEEWERIFAVNVTGVFNMCQFAIRDMITKGKGAIVNVSSIWGVKGASCEAHYSATKAAVISLTESLAKEYGLSGIRVNCVAPGVIDTRMNSHLDEEAMESLAEEAALGKIGKADEVAETIYFLASEKASFITGQTLLCDGGFL